MQWIKKPVVVGILTASGTLGSTVLADDALVLEPLVVSAAGFEKKLTEAPASITVVGREELQKKSYGNLAEALDDVEGIDVRQSTGKTGGLNVSFRGMPSEYTLILIDGRRQNAAGNVTPNGFGSTSTSFMPPVSAIERIEVVRGPMSTLYGSDAMGGVINIITRKVAKEWTTSLTVDYTANEDSDYGDDGKVSLYTTAPIIEDTLGFSIYGNFQRRDDSDLEFDNGDTVNRRGAAPVEGHNFYIGGKLSFTPNEDHELTLELQRGRQYYENDNCQLGTLDGFTGNGTNGCTATTTAAKGYSDELRFERDQVAITHTGRFTFGTLTSSLMHNETETIGRTIPGTIGVIDSAGMLGGGPRNLETTNIVFDTKLSTQLTDNHHLTVGGQYWDAEMDDGIAFETFEQKTWALFAEDEWRLLDNLALTFGGRYDHHDAFGSHVSPRAYLVWNTTDNWTMKGGVSKAYKTPSLNDLHNGINGVTGQGTILTIGSPDLDPEESTSTEVGVYYDNLSGFNFNATLFHNEFDDKIASGPELANCSSALNPNLPGCVDYGAQYTQDSFSQKVNVDEAVTKGVELAARWQFLPDWSLTGNYTFTHSEQKSGDNKGRPLTNTPKHMLNSSLNWDATPKLAVSLKAEYRGERERFLDKYSNLSGSDQVIHDVEDKLKAYAIFHLAGSYKLSEKTTLSATVYNLFDKDFLDGETYSGGYVPDYIHSSKSVTGTVEQGRRLWISLTTEF